MTLATRWLAVFLVASCCTAVLGQTNTTTSTTSSTTTTTTPTTITTTTDNMTTTTDNMTTTTDNTTTTTDNMTANTTTTTTMANMTTTNMTTTTTHNMTTNMINTTTTTGTTTTTTGNTTNTTTTTTTTAGMTTTGTTTTSTSTTCSSCLPTDHNITNDTDVNDTNATNQTNSTTMTSTSMTTTTGTTTMTTTTTMDDNDTNMSDMSNHSNDTEANMSHDNQTNVTHNDTANGTANDTDTSGGPDDQVANTTTATVTEGTTTTTTTTLAECDDPDRYTGNFSFYTEVEHNDSAHGDVWLLRCESGYFPVITSICTDGFADSTVKPVGDCIAEGCTGVTVVTGQEDTGTTCPSLMQEGDVCTKTCTSEAELLGVWTCMNGELRGGPVCVDREAHFWTMVWVLDVIVGRIEFGTLWEQYSKNITNASSAFLTNVTEAFLTSIDATVNDFQLLEVFLLRSDVVRHPVTDMWLTYSSFVINFKMLIWDQNRFQLYNETMEHIIRPDFPIRQAFRDHLAMMDVALTWLFYFSPPMTYLDTIVAPDTDASGACRRCRGSAAALLLAIGVLLLGHAVGFDGAIGSTRMSSSRSLASPGSLVSATATGLRPSRGRRRLVPNANGLPHCSR